MYTLSTTITLSTTSTLSTTVTLSSPSLSPHYHSLFTITLPTITLHSPHHHSPLSPPSLFPPPLSPPSLSTLPTITLHSLHHHSPLSLPSLSTLPTITLHSPHHHSPRHHSPHHHSPHHHSPHHHSPLSPPSLSTLPTSRWCILSSLPVCLPGSGVFLESAAGHEELSTHTQSTSTGQRRYSYTCTSVYLCADTCTWRIVGLTTCTCPCMLYVYVYTNVWTASSVYSLYIRMLGAELYSMSRKTSHF